MQTVANGYYLQLERSFISDSMRDLLLASLFLALVFALTSGLARRRSYVQSNIASWGLGFFSALMLICAMIVLWKEVLTPFVTDVLTAGMAACLIALLLVFSTFIIWGFYRLGTKL